MTKEKLGALNVLYPLPTTLVGVTVDGKANFITIAHVGVMTHVHLSLSIGKNHYSNAGILENKTFSVCLPSEDLVVETDYCGLVSGKTTDKSALFDVFYGDLENAPMIAQCRVCMECRLDRVIDFPTHHVFVGEIVQTWADSSVLDNGDVDIMKLEPLLFDMTSRQYWSLGFEVAKCWNVGKQLKQNER